MCTALEPTILYACTADRLDVSDDDDEDEEGSSIDDATAASLPALRSLGIGGNDISDEAAEAFGSMLLENDGKGSLQISPRTTTVQLCSSPPNHAHVVNIAMTTVHV